MSDDEIRQLIIHADAPMLVGMCCWHTHNQRKMFMVPMQAKEALKRELIVCLDGEIVDSERCYAAEIQLTEAGREFCGLPKLKTVEVAKKEKSKVRSLFD